MIRCGECKRKLSLVETVVGPCAGCNVSLCTHHRSSHLETCQAFHTVKAQQGKDALATRLRQEATKSSKGLTS